MVSEREEDVIIIPEQPVVLG